MKKTDFDVMGNDRFQKRDFIIGMRNTILYEQETVSENNTKHHV